MEFPWNHPYPSIIADIVMQYLENNVLNNNNVQLSFYYRYVDDIIFATQDTNVSYILEAFNNYYQRIKFMERENNRCFSFLDLLLIVKDNIMIDWFHIKKVFQDGFYLFLFSPNMS